MRCGACRDGVRRLVAPETAVKVARRMAADCSFPVKVMVDPELLVIGEAPIAAGRGTGESLGEC